MFSPKIPGIGRSIVALSLLAGIFLAVQGEIGTLNATVTGSGGGYLLVNPAVPSGEPMLVQAELHGAAPFVPKYESAAAARQLVIGMLLILLGFFFHAYLMTRGERPVSVHGAPLSPPARETTEDMMPFERIRQKSEKKYYWMEIRV